MPNKIGWGLSCDGGPFTFFSKALGPKHQGLSIYEKEYMATLITVKSWRYYLKHDEFIIKIDHKSLKHLLKQKIHTYLQKKVLTKLLGLR